MLLNPATLHPEEISSYYFLKFFILFFFYSLKMVKKFEVEGFESFKAKAEELAKVLYLLLKLFLNVFKDFFRLEEKKSLLDIAIWMTGWLIG